MTELLKDPSYKELLRTWEKDTAVRSDPATDHPSYVKLVAAGHDAVPTLLHAVGQRSGWRAITALRTIFGDLGPNTSDVSGEFEKICQRWLAWAKENTWI